MTTRSDRIGLIKPTTADPFVTADLATNLQTLDDHPGLFLCTNATRPTDWGSHQNGMRIFETDTGWEFFWDGTDFQRSVPVGFLGSAVRTSPFTNTSTSPQTVVQVAVTVPNPGHTPSRRPKITVAWPRFTAVGKRVAFSITGSLPSPLDWEWQVGADVLNDTQCPGGSMTVFDAPLTADTWDNITYAFKVRALTAFPGSYTMFASAGDTITITVEES